MKTSVIAEPKVDTVASLAALAPPPALPKPIDAAAPGTTATAIAAQPKGEAWHSQSAEEVLAKLSSATNGLFAQDAAKRFAADGPNELKEGKRISPFQIFLGQFKSLIIWILIAAGVLSGVLGEGSTPLPTRTASEVLQACCTRGDAVVFAHDNDRNREQSGQHPAGHCARV